jgi:hypothetical protein
VTEPFDAELSRAIKQSTEQELESWEFSTDMQRGVLDRIRAEESGAVPASRRSRRFNPARLLRPAAWTAVAAAAVLIAVHTDLGGMGGAATKSAPSKPEVVQSQPAAPTAKQAAPNSADQAPAAPGAGEGNQVAVTAQDQNTAAPAPAEAKRADGPPGQMALAPVQPAAGGPKALAAPATQPYAGGIVALDLPPAEKTKDGAPVMAIMASVGDKVALTATAAGRVVELSGSGVREFVPDGAELWSRPVEGVTDESLLATADDGSIAVAVAGRVEVISAAGKAVSTLKAGALVTSLAWSQDGRLAVAADSAVTIFSVADGKPQFRTEGFTRPDLAFAPDGALAVYGGGKGGRRLALYSLGGAVLMQTEQAGTDGDGLVFTPRGLLAGPLAYDRQGGTLWKTPVMPEGITELRGTGLLLTWNRGEVVSVRAEDGIPVWKATWGRPGDGIRQVVTSPDGRLVAVVAGTDEGWAIWVLDQNGKVLLAERLLEQPTGIAFAGDRLVFLAGGSVQFRTIAQ